MRIGKPWREEGLWRWIATTSGAVVILLLIAWGGWYWWSRVSEAQLDAFARASQLYREVITEGKAAQGEEAKRALEDFLARHSRSAVAGVAAYYLGNLQYQVRQYESARASYARALERGSRDDLVLVARLGIAYSWEAQGQYANALKAYQDGLANMAQKNFLYEEFLLAQARLQELQQDVPRALDSYRQLLRDRPESRRAEEIRARIASLEGQGKK